MRSPARLEIPRYSRMVPLDEISDPKNDFNLNLPRYIDSSEPEDIQDIDGHLRGGIPDRDLDALQRYWNVFPGVREALFKAGRPGYSDLNVAAADIKTTIFGHAEFTDWSSQTQKLFATWRAEVTPRLVGIQQGDKPKVPDRVAGRGASEHVPEREAAGRLRHLPAPDGLLGRVDAGRRLSDRQRRLARRRQAQADGRRQGQEVKDKPDFTLGKQKFKAELIPPALLIARYFAAEQAAIDKLESEAAAVSQALEELVEEHGGEDGLLCGSQERQRQADEGFRRLRDSRQSVSIATLPEERKVLASTWPLPTKNWRSASRPRLRRKSSPQKSQPVRQADRGRHQGLSSLRTSGWPRSSGGRESSTVFRRP